MQQDNIIPQQQSNQTLDVDGFLRRQNLSVKKNVSSNDRKQEINWETFDTIILDADNTMWICVDNRGETMPAFETVPPYFEDKEGDNNVAYDSEGNKIILKDSLVERLTKLKSQGKGIYLISWSEDVGVGNEAEQPVNQILEYFGILDLFDDVILDKGIPKSKYVNKVQEGKTVFVDDDTRQLIDVSQHTEDVVPVDATKIKY